MNTGRFSTDFPKDGKQYFFDIAIEDASEALKEAHETGGARQRRNAVRAVFAFIDGCHDSVRRHVEVQAKTYGHLYSISELAVLREESPYVDERGNVKTRQLKVPLITSIKVLVKLLTKNDQAKHHVDLSHSGFVALTQSIEIRHRVVHPKCAADLDLSSDDMDIVGQAFHWYLAFTIRMNHATIKSLESHTNRH